MVISYGHEGVAVELKIMRRGEGWTLVYSRPGEPDVHVGFDTEAEIREELTWLLAGSMRPTIDLGTAISREINPPISR